jgi:hypothetical protein
MILRFCAALCATALLATPAFAQENKPVRVRGTVEQMSGAMMTVKSRGGETLQIKLADDAKVVALVKASLADIKPGSFVGSTAMPEDNGHWRAVEVHIFPEAMRGTGEGDRPYDYKPKSTMTNGTVGSGNTAGGTVGSATPQAGSMAMTLTFKDGTKTIDVVPDTVIVKYEPGDKAELKPGAMIYIPAATKQADGTLMTGRVNVGRGIAPPM